MDGVFLWVLVLFSALMVAAAAGGTKAEPAAPPPDREVGVASDDQVRWIVNEYGTMIYRVAVTIVHDAALAEDVVQDTIFKAWMSMPSWENPAAARWLRTVARNGAISAWRRRARTTEDAALDGRAASDVDVESVVENRALAEAMRGVLAGLDPDSRTLIVLREAEELSYEEMAHLLGLSVAAVKAKLYRARQTLKAELRDWEL
jgi:RNA polymerase sigma-70 factor (ECF subfamily)